MNARKDPKGSFVSFGAFKNNCRETPKITAIIEAVQRETRKDWNPMKKPTRAASFTSPKPIVSFLKNMFPKKRIERTVVNAKAAAMKPPDNVQGATQNLRITPRITPAAKTVFGIIKYFQSIIATRNITREYAVTIVNSGEIPSL